LIALGLSALAYQWQGSQWQNSRQGNTPAAGTSFDFYLMAYSLHPAFCENGNARRRECQRLTAADNARRPISIHGLWPENDRSGSYPHDCAGPRLSLSSELRAELDQWMPGTASGLQQHEWRKHGTCSGLDASRYFRLSIDFTRDVNAALGRALLAHTERQVAAAELRTAANAYRAGFGDTLTFHCQNLKGADPVKRGRPYLFEIRQCIDDDGPGGAPATLLSCSSVKRRDQGCGARFWIDGV